MKKELLTTASRVCNVRQYLQQKAHPEHGKVKALFQVKQVDRKKLLRRR